MRPSNVPIARVRLLLPPFSTLSSGVSTAFVVLVALFGCAADPQQPDAGSEAFTLTRVGELRVQGEARSIAVAGGVAYLGCGSDGVVAIDVTEPTAPEVLSRLETVRADAVAFSEDRLFVLGRPRAVQVLAKPVLTVIDAIDPRALLEIGRQEIDGACAFAGSTARCAMAAGDRILVGAESSRPETIAAGAPGERAIAVAWRGDRVAALTSPEASLFGGGRGAATLRLFEGKDHARSGSLALGDALETFRCDAADVVLGADRAYVAGGDCVFLVGLADATSPGLADWIALPGARALALGRGFLAVAAEGLAVIDLSTPGKLAVAKRLDPAGVARDVSVAGDLVFVAAGELGLRIYRVERVDPVERTDRRGRSDETKPSDLDDS